MRNNAAFKATLTKLSSLLQNGKYPAPSRGLRSVIQFEGPPGEFKEAILSIGNHVPRACPTREKSRLRKSEQGDKWSFCLTAGKIGPRIRRDDEQTSTPESFTGLQGEGGAGSHQGRPDDSPTGRAFRRSR